MLSSNAIGIFLNEDTLYVVTRFVSPHNQCQGNIMNNRDNEVHEASRI